MSATMLPYGLYGLTDGNPYVQRALGPLKWPSDSDRLLGLNGFVQHEQVLTYLSRKVADKEPAFILIGGRNLTGPASCWPRSMRPCSCWPTPASTRPPSCATSA
jgi:hypothetical protein